MAGLCGLRVPVVVAILAAAAAATFTVRAQAVRPAPVHVSGVEYVLSADAPARVGEIRLALGAAAREVHVRLGRGPWLPCRVDGDRAACRVPPGQGDVERLGRISVAQIR